MKLYAFVAFLAFIAISAAVFVPPRPGHHNKKFSGNKECVSGPTYWCQNLTAASSCHAVKHCIQTVWEHQTLPEDRSSVCEICLDMVKQARDQLESNETQELIKEVFEGSCALLKLKPVVKECDKIADEYIPDLIDTLASQMNPQVVCSVAGLCNNAKVHKLLEEAGEIIPAAQAADTSCKNCHTVIDALEEKFNKLSRDELLQGFLRNCGQMSSFSDGCSNIVVTYFQEIYSHLQEHLNSNEICLMSGECSAQFHTHQAKVEITPVSRIGYVPVNDDSNGTDLTCDLCEQLVTHLREVLVANTTEDEFKQVMEGLCEQTGKFATECVSLVNQYYAEIYGYLVQELKPNGLCTLIGLCHPVKKVSKVSYLTPLLPPETAKLAQVLTQTEKQQNLVRVPLYKSDQKAVKITPSGFNKQSEVPQQLPIDLLMPPHTQILYNKEVCQFCEYFLHECQEQITEPQTEEKIKQIIDKACSKLPDAVNSTCVDFVNTYEPALVALLAQEIDPSQICPLIRACPASNSGDVEIFMQAKGNSNCPLCLFAVTKLEDMVKDKKTKVDIQNALQKVCTELPKSMIEECKDFVQTYTDELVEMLIADLKPQEVCVYLKMCTDDKPASPLPPYVYRHKSGDIETNIIPDNTVNGHLVIDYDASVEDSPQCVMCEFVMSEIEDQLKNNKTDQKIEDLVRSICKVMPRSVNKQCSDFINQYGDSVIQLLISALEPDEICSMIKLCKNKLQAFKVEILECPVCQLTVEAMDKILANPKVDHDVEHVLEKTCRGLPKEYRDRCEDMIDRYGEEIFRFIVKGANANYICKKFGLCNGQHPQIWLGTHHCTYGPSYWCESQENADQCGARAHCEAKVWKGQRPLPKHERLVGGNKCTYGPSYWCQNQQTADECKARQHCESKVWKRIKRQTQALGTKKCTYGPSYWCTNEQTADECKAREHCETKVWNRTKRQTKAVGANPCTWGPSYWCTSEKNADECQARAHCESKVWNRTKRQTKAVGANPCTWGPSYWCSNEKNADECQARAHCESKVWNKNKSN